jgi:hypothetical protein
MAIGKQLSDGNPDGTGLGQSASDLISFFAATPVVQQTAPAAITTTILSSHSTQINNTVWAFASQTQASGAITAINTFRTILNNLGLSA